jgi:hypothetical protein
MAKIKIEDLPMDKEITKEEMKKFFGGPSSEMGEIFRKFLVEFDDQENRPLTGRNQIIQCRLLLND